MESIVTEHGNRATESIVVEAMSDREAEIRARYASLASTMNERATRLWLAAEAKAYGRGGVLAVWRATGIRPKRVSAGLRDLEEGAELPGVVRRPGGGRTPLVEIEVGL